MKVLIAGAGLTGCILAERLASAGHTILVREQRSHIAGNCYDYENEHGILVHAFGPHVFHTNAKHIVWYLSKFTAWRSYEHRVLASVLGQLVPFPINATTLRMLGASLAPVKRDPIVTSEDVVFSTIGPTLCDLFYRGYTRKQWGRDLSELSASVAARIPVRNNTDDRYFTDAFQSMPLDGYTAMCQKLLNHPNITVELESTELGSAALVPSNFKHDLLIYTGAIDAYFGYSLGRLPYRSLRFEFEHFDGLVHYQKTGAVNYPDPNVPYTRITEFKHLTGQKHSGTTIAREYPVADGDPYYPVPTPESAALLAKYWKLASSETKTMFAGRLGQYRYYNMDQAVAAALHLAERLGVNNAVAAQEVAVA